jgi:TRAP-type C4-dicarboxylate transport system permease small subunit
VSFAAIILSVASQQVFTLVVFVYFVIDSVRKLLDILLYQKLAFFCGLQDL